MVISDYAVKFRTAVFVFVVVFGIVGAMCYKALPREAAPDITIPYVFVTAIYKGTAPAEMEKLVTVPLEKELKDIENIKEIKSSSAESVASISIEFNGDQNIDEARQKVKNKVDLARPDLPTDIDEPIVDAFNFSTDSPIYIMALSGGSDPERLRSVAEDIQDDLEALPGVKEAALSGALEREIRVEFDLEKLVANDIPVAAIMGRIMRENSNISAGNIETKGNKFQVRVPGEFKFAGQMSDIIIAHKNNKPIYLRDIATVSDAAKDLTSVTRINGERCVSLSIKKRSGENTVDIVKRVKAKMEGYTLPAGLKLTEVMDESVNIDSMVKELENSIASGALFVIIVIGFFMGMRNTLMVALALPMSFLLTFTVLVLMGQTLNMIVLFSLVLVSGMLVDDAIVIVENTYRNRTLGLSKDDAARRGASEVAWPVITSTLTNVVVFSPLLFWPDIMGQFMSFLPKTVMISLMASLAVGLIINPAVCSLFIKPADKPHDQSPFMQNYEKFLRSVIRHRFPVMMIVICILILSVQVYAYFGRGFELFPTIDPRNGTVDVKYPQGTSIRTTDAALQKVETRLLGMMKDYKDIKFVLTTVGASGGQMMPGAGANGTHMGNVLVQFKNPEERSEGCDTGKILEKIRNEIAAIPGAEVVVNEAKEGPPTGAPISIQIAGDDFDVLGGVIEDVEAKIRDIPDLVDLRTDMEEALPEMQFIVDRKKAALLDLDTETIGMFLRSSIYGMETSKFRTGEEEYDITVRLPERQRSNIKLLDEIFIPTMQGSSVPLTSIGRVEYAGGLGVINRQDQKRVITLIANVTGGREGRGSDAVLGEIKTRLNDFRVPTGYQLKYEGENKEMEKAGSFLFRAFLFAIAFVAVILVLQFNSAVLPGIIMFSVVLSIIGVMWGLLICDMRFGVIMTGIGVISLAGVVVKNCIVLIDCIQRRREEGLDAVEAAIAAGKLRLRPVLLTAGTAILGLIPVALGYSIEIHGMPRIVHGVESSQWWAPMAVAIIFGLGLATILTLVYVPTMYVIADSIAEKMKAKFAIKD